MSKEKKELLTLKESARYLGIGDFRMRHIILENKVTATKVKEGHINKWYVEKDSLDRYQSTKGRSKDGKKAFLVRLSPEELEVVTKFLTEREIEIGPRYVSKKK